MLTICEQVDEFVHSSSRNQWLSDGILEVYVRKSIRFFDNQKLTTFDIANIHSINPQYKGKGYFKSFMKKVESIGRPVYVENIQNPYLVEMLEKNGYEILTSYITTHAIKF